MRLGIPVYEGVDLLDVAGPAEMFYWAGKDQPLETLILSEDGGPVTAMNGIRFEVQASFADVPALDVLWVPGGDPEVLGQIMSDPGSPYLAYLRQVAEDATWVCSVCEGALLLAQAGLLDGHRATTHWAFIACLQRFCEIDVDTGKATVIDPPTQGQGARRIWSDSRGRVFVSYWNTGQVGMYDPTTRTWREWKLPGVAHAYSVWVDPADHVWLTDWSTNAIVRFDPATEKFESFPSDRDQANVRQMLGRAGEAWGAESGTDRLVVVRD